jgi:plasmid stabilization system protein ParE
MRVVVHSAYERKVDEELDYLIENGAFGAAQRLLNQAYDDLPDLLMKFPRIGRDFLARNPEAPEARSAWNKTREFLGDDIELREYLLGDYLVLYALHGKTIHLLTMRHHRQAGFDVGKW